MKGCRAQVLILAALCVFLAPLCIRAQAQDVQPQAKKGSVQITLEDTDAADAAFRLYRTGDVFIENDFLNCTPVPEFQNNGMPFDDLRADGLAEHLNAFAAWRNVPIYARKHSSGESIRFESLPMGMYLAVPEGSSAEKAIAFVFTIPSKDAKGEWIYDLQVYPKNPDTARTCLQVEKQWAGSENSRPEQIEVWLMKNGVRFDTAFLSAQTHWTHTWDDLQQGAVWTAAEVNVPKGYTVQYVTQPNQMTIINSGIENQEIFLQTGQLKWPIPILLAAGIGFLFAGCFNPKRSR